jgi:hypothetical protein
MVRLITLSALPAHSFLCSEAVDTVWAAQEGRDSATTSGRLRCRQVVLASRETWKYLVMCLARAQLPSCMPGLATACVTAHGRPRNCLLASQRPAPLFQGVGV